MGQRKSLSAANNGVDLFRQAIGAIPPNEYERWVTIHRNGAIHVNSNYFLAWHRAYLYFFEKRLQELVPGVTVPYWDWTRLPEVPRDFLGAGNPLNHPRNPGRIVPTLPNLSSIEGPTGLLSIGSYHSFAQRLESGAHNRVHNWVGADMANISISPRDPLFWCHHSHVDHLWDRWQRSHTYDGPAEPSFRLNIGSGRVISVREVLRITDLDYEYVATTIDLPTAEKAPADDGSEQWQFSLPKESQVGSFEQAEFRLAGVPLPKHHPYEIRVFCGRRGATESTLTDDSPEFVGYFDMVVLGHDHKHGHSVGSSDRMDISFDVSHQLKFARAPIVRNEKQEAEEAVLTLVPIGDAREFRFEQASIVLRE